MNTIRRSIELKSISTDNHLPHIVIISIYSYKIVIMSLSKNIRSANQINVRRNSLPTHKVTAE
jgi:hypothetical protein